LIKYLTRHPVFFLVIYLAAGIFTIRDFGVPLDDFTQYVIGQENYHVLIGEKKMETIDPGIRYYGPVFETFCYAIDSLFYGEPEPIQKWGMRHALVFLLFTIALLYLWKLALYIFKDSRVAWVLLLLTAFYPRLFSDAHYNSKDTVFLSIFTIGLYHLCKAIGQKHTRTFIIAGVLLGLASTIRLSGFFILPALLITWLLVFKEYKKLRSWIAQPIIFVVFFLLSYYTFFPALWHDPLSEFSTLVQRITNFPWPHNTLVAGHWVGPDNMPWWYFPVWFFITVPVLYHIIFLISVVLIFYHGKKFFSEPSWILVLSFFSFTVIYVLALQPNLYDSWRQLQFLFVPFVLVLGISIHWMYQNKNLVVRRFPVIVVVYHIVICLWLHPHQYVYFNEAYWVLGKSNSYDQDYWNLSTGNCMGWIQEHSEKKRIKIYTFNTESGWYNSFLFPKEWGKEFIPVATREQADYEIAAIRNSRPYDPKLNVVHSICPLKDTIARVIEIKK
jgi:hypothetical protein